MNLVAFWIFGGTALLALVLCVTRRNAVHAVLYLLGAFLAIAAILFGLGAPLPAAWQVLVYAGAILVLFLFVLMTLHPPPAMKPRRARELVLPALVAAGNLAGALALVLAGSGGREGLPGYVLPPAALGRALFADAWIGVEAVSFLLLFAAVGAFWLGRREDPPKERP
ncbi:MAG: NADH-quinone oxidoreductase subunit J [Myxococcales bacterium]|nr:NADH-quinone oxidoreductase subunit J [Myxococcales bacterium]